jgi:hypothetical protein
VLLICAGFWEPYAASAQPKSETGDSSGREEQSAQSAAGGKMSLMHIRKFCEDDVKKLCPDIRPGGGRIVQCLHGHESSLTPGCRQVLAPRSSNP